MLRFILPGLVALAGCAAPPASPPMQIASALTSSDPTLMAAFFGPGGHRAISPVIRCPVRCQGAQ